MFIDQIKLNRLAIYIIITCCIFPVEDRSISRQNQIAIKIGSNEYEVSILPQGHFSDSLLQEISLENFKEYRCQKCNKLLLTKTLYETIISLMRLGSPFETIKNYMENEIEKSKYGSNYN